MTRAVRPAKDVETKAEDYEKLMADEDLARLSDLVRVSEDIFDIIDLSENQHSNMMGWLLDSREGHGQGDAILRDLLVYAAIVAGSENCKLDPHAPSAKFFKSWPVSRIRNTSFASAFFARELGLAKTNRTDIFVVDPVNKFIILIENKNRGKQAAKQLKEYRENFDELVKSNRHLKSYDTVFVAMRRHFDPDHQPLADFWLHIGYDWLNAAASRALLDVNRGNNAAKLIVSYCNRQTDWESPIEKQCTDLASSIHQRHPSAVKSLIDNSYGRTERRWLEEIQPSAPLVFSLLHRGVIAALKEAKGMVSLKNAICKKIPEIPVDSVEHGRAWLDVCPKGWERFEGDWWPLVINVRFSDSTKSRYNLNVVWDASAVAKGFDAAQLRSRLVALEPKFGRFNNSNWRRVHFASEIGLAELEARVSELYVSLEYDRK